MFSWEMMQSFLFLGVISVVIIGYAVVLGRKEEPDSDSHDVLKRSA